MSYRICVSILMVLIAAAISPAYSGETKNSPPSEKIPTGTKIFVAPIADGFDTY